MGIACAKWVQVKGDHVPGTTRSGICLARGKGCAWSVRETGGPRQAEPWN